MQRIKALSAVVTSCPKNVTQTDSFLGLLRYCNFLAELFDFRVTIKSECTAFQEGELFIKGDICGYIYTSVNILF